MSVVKLMVLTAMLSHYQAGESFETPQVEIPPVQQVGLASWYGNGAWHGEITANGEKFDPSDFTCAHRSLPFDTMVLIENRANGRRVWCRINDRGPYGYKSDDGSWDFRVSSSSEINFRGILDMSVATAEALGTTQVGLQRVNLRYWPRRSEKPFDLAILNP
jgi:rare lipoprotein A (peptidoglycan hydrolase)